MTSIDEVERETGLDFFSELPSVLQDRIEGEKTVVMW